MSMREKASAIGLSKGVVQRLLKDQEKIQEADVNLKAKKAATPTSDKHEVMVLDWIQKCLGRQIPLSQSMVIEAGKRMKTMLSKFQRRKH
ncbi:MAG: hypothetical protein MHMPM18_001092 [Marteilia pararefringens]